MKLSEMTMQVGSYEQLGSALEYYKKFKKKKNFAGDIETFKVYREREKEILQYVVIDGKKAVAFFGFNDATNTLQTAYVVPELRKKGLFSAFLFFLKRNEGFNRIVLGELHSEATIEAVKRIHKRFNAYWEKGDDKEPYDPNNLSKYYSLMRPTGWKLVLENDGDFSLWPKIFNPTLLETYYFDPFIEKLE